MGLMWSKLQREPFGALDSTTLEEYRTFLADLRAKGVKVMMVLHHFTNPRWFTQKGHWERSENIAMWVDFCEKVVAEFGPYVSYWNTFNEPNVYVSYGWITGFFPPFKRNPILALRVLRNLSKAHERVYDVIKRRYPTHPVGISHNAVVLDHVNWMGWLPAKMSDWWFMEYVPSFFSKSDFFGMSYYCRVSHDPFPITNVDTPAKIKALGKRHDDMWEYYPVGMRECLNRYWKKYKKPIIITESGVCDDSDNIRQGAIVDYARIIHGALRDGIDIRGYYWWSTWDNFEWHLGPSKRFGLYDCDPVTKERRPRPSAEIYRTLAHTGTIPA